MGGTNELSGAKKRTFSNGIKTVFQDHPLSSSVYRVTITNNTNMTYELTTTSNVGSRTYLPL